MTIPRRTTPVKTNVVTEALDTAVDTADDAVRFFKKRYVILPLLALGVAQNWTPQQYNKNLSTKYFPHLHQVDYTAKPGDKLEYCGINEGFGGRMIFRDFTGIEAFVNYAKSNPDNTRAIGQDNYLQPGTVIRVPTLDNIADCGPREQR